MDDEKDLKDLEVGAKFKRIKQMLLSELARLDSTINNELADVNKTGKNIELDDIKKILQDIDSMIMNNRQIKNALLEGNSEVKKIIDSINHEVKSRIEELKENIVKDEDEEEIDKLGKEFEENSMNKRQRNIDEFEAGVDSIGSKTEKEREEEAAKKEAEFEERAEAAKAYQRLRTADPSVDETTLIQETKDANEAFRRIKKADDKEIGSAEDYKDDVSKIKDMMNQVLTGKLTLNEILANKDEFNKMVKKLRNLESFMDPATPNKELKDLVDAVETFSKQLDEDEKGGKKKTDAERLGDIEAAAAVLYTNMDDGSVEKIDFDKTVDSAIKRKEKAVPNALKALLTSKVFEYDPELKKKLEEELNGENPDIEGIETKISDFLSGMSVHKIRQSIKDEPNIDQLEAEKEKYGKVRKNLEDRRGKRSTASIKISGYDEEIGLTDEHGEPIDFTKLDDAGKEEAADAIFEKLNADGKIVKRIEETYDRLPDAINNKRRENPGLFARIAYKVNPAHWFNGKSLRDVRREESEAARKAYIDAHVAEEKDKFIDEIDKTQEEAKNRPAWYLTPDQQKAFRDRETQIVEGAKKSAREAIVTDTAQTRTGKEVLEDAQRDAENEQFKDDSEERD